MRTVGAQVIGNSVIYKFGTKIRFERTLLHLKFLPHFGDIVCNLVGGKLPNRGHRLSLVAVEGGAAGRLPRLSNAAEARALLRIVASQRLTAGAAARIDSGLFLPVADAFTQRDVLLGRHQKKFDRQQEAADQGQTGGNDIGAAGPAEEGCQAGIGIVAHG